MESALPDMMHPIAVPSIYSTFLKKPFLFFCTRALCCCGRSPLARSQLAAQHVPLFLFSSKFAFHSRGSSAFPRHGLRRSAGCTAYCALLLSAATEKLENNTNQNSTSRS